jgi:hypothetical protein
MIKAEDRLRTCPRCGAALDLSSEEDATVTITASGGRPNVWIIAAGGREVHRCTDENSAEHA